jgi:hypothetical protein
VIGGLALAVAAVLVGLSVPRGTSRTDPSAPTGSGVTNVGVLRIAPTEPIPADLSRVRYLLLDATRDGRVAALKARYPELEVLEYKDLSFLIDYSHGPSGNAGVPWEQAREEWFLRDASGARVESVHYPGFAFADVGSPGYQQAWLDEVLASLKRAPWDGVFVDDALADPAWQLGGDYARLASYPTRAAYAAAEGSILGAVGPALRQAGYLVIANVTAAPEQAPVWGGWAFLLSGAMREHFVKPGSSTEPVDTGSDWRAAVQAEQAVEGRGKIFLGLSYGRRNDTPAQTYTRASFLLFDRPSTRSASLWSPAPTAASSSDLGPPVGPASQQDGVWTRQFREGTVQVDPTRGTSSITRRVSSP